MSEGLSEKSSVLAIISHYRCEDWLADAIEGLIAQERPLDGIVVVDDCSSVPPIDIVKRYPGVTLLASAENVGTYRLKQQVIDGTNYDAYLFEDADDWSSPDRLERLLDAAVRTGAELVGSNEVQIWLTRASVATHHMPPDVNAALAFYPSVYPLNHPSSLVGRDLTMRIGGFSTGLRFAADTEFLLRAQYAARIVNVPFACHFRRIRPGSLTTAPGTGMNSVERMQIRAALLDRAGANVAALTRGETPDLSPYATAPPVQLFHLLGPELERIAAAPAPSDQGTSTEHAVPAVPLTLVSDPLSRGPVDFGPGAVTEGTPSGTCPRSRGGTPSDDGTRPRRLTRHASVLAFIPYLQHEDWLVSTIVGLMTQTRVPDAIVVVDDASSTLPVAALRPFPQVTLLAAAHSVGPYGLFQKIIESTAYDAYLYQDAGDWSAPDRLEELLDEGERSNARLVGSYAVHLDATTSRAMPLPLPCDVNAALSGPARVFPFYFPTSIVARDLVVELGGFAAGMTDHADMDFLRRAGHATAIRNVPRYSYFRRASWFARHATQGMVELGVDELESAQMRPTSLTHILGPALTPADTAAGRPGWLPTDLDAQGARDSRP